MLIIKTIIKITQQRLNKTFYHNKKSHNNLLITLAIRVNRHLLIPEQAAKRVHNKTIILTDVFDGQCRVPKKDQVET